MSGARANRPRSVLVRPDHRAVEADFDEHVAHHIRLAVDAGQEPLPSAISPPAHEAVVTRLPRPIPFREGAPGRAGAHLPEDPVDDLAMSRPRRPSDGKSGAIATHAVAVNSPPPTMP
jgi:hypothetical protein